MPDKQATLELTERFSLVLEATGNAVWDCDLVSGLVKHNPRWCEMLGFSDDLLEHHNRLYFDLIHPDDKSIVTDAFGAACTGDGLYAAEYRIRHADGHYIWVQDRGRIVSRAPDGAPLRALGAFTDITERKMLEGELRLQTDAINHMAEGVVIVDGLGTILYTNPTFDAMFGYPRGELLGQHGSVCNASSASDPVETARQILDALARDGEWKGEIHNRRKDGSEFWTHVSVRRFDHHRHGQVWLAVQSDITAVRELRLERDAALHAMERLSSHIQEDMEQLRRTLAREVHDEIGAQLTGIRMRLEAIKRSPPAPDDASALGELIEAVNQAIVSSRRLCTQLRPPMLDDLGLLETCRWYLADWARTAAIATGADWDELPDNLPNALSTDLFRIFQELLTNVARHAQAHRVHIELRHDASSLRLRVRDDGRGFAKRGDTGFGLSGIRERLRRHGGQMTIADARPGCEVTICIPLAG